MGLDQYWYLEKPETEERAHEIDHVVYWRKCWIFHNVFETYIADHEREIRNCTYVGVKIYVLERFMVNALSYVDESDYRAVSEVASCVSDIAEMLLHNPDIDEFYYYAWW